MPKEPPYQYHQRDADGNTLCGHVATTWCDESGACLAEDRPKCMGHRKYCREWPHVVIQQIRPGDVIYTGYYCAEHWESSLIDWNDFPPDPGYERAHAALYKKGTSS